MSALDLRFAAGLDRALAARGVAAGTQRAVALAEVLREARPARVLDLYWLARIAMLPDNRDLAAFDAAFVHVANGLAGADVLAALVQNVPDPTTERPAKAPRPSAPPPPSDERLDDCSDEAIFLAMASADEQLSQRDFAEMDDAERLRAQSAMERLRIASELRRSRRRWAAARGDRLDVRATMRASARTAGELIRRRTSARRERPRPLVFLCDVSGSMLPYARALLQYARVASLARPRVRAFAFATELTELTDIARRSPDRSVMKAFAAVLRDYGGGTRIGAALHAFNERFAQRGAARGATVVILSDGWEREEPALVGTEMGRLRRLSHKIVWVNPQKKHVAFEPLAGGMAAALPYVDAFIAGHNLRSLDAIAAAIEKTTAV